MRIVKVLDQLKEASNREGSYHLKQSVVCLRRLSRNTQTERKMSPPNHTIQVDISKEFQSSQHLFEGQCCR